MNDISDEQIQSLATEWMNKIKSNVGLTLISLPEKRASELEETSAGKDSYSTKQVQKRCDVISRNGHQCDYPSLLVESGLDASAHNPAHPSLFDNRKTGSYEKHRVKDSSDRDQSLSFDNNSQKSFLSSTISKKDQCKHSGEEQRTKNSDYCVPSASKDYRSWESQTMPVKHTEYINLNNLTSSSNSDFGDNAMKQASHNDLFDIWDFDDDQCKTALKYLDKARKEDDDKPKSPLKKENFPEKFYANDHDTMLPMKVISGEESSAQKGKSDTNIFNDITNTKHDASNRMDYSELIAKEIDLKTDSINPDSGYYRICPVCYQKNDADANWCEECGKALLSVEVRKCSEDMKTEKNHKENLCLISSASPESPAVMEDKNKSTFKLNPNSAEFVSAYASKQSPEETSKFDCYSSHSSSPNNHRQRGRACSLQMHNSRSQFAGYAGSLQRDNFGNLDKVQASPKPAWSPTHFSPESSPVGYGNACSNENLIAMDTLNWRGNDRLGNSYDGVYVSQGSYPKSCHYFQNMTKATTRQNISQAQPCKASFSYDSSFNCYLQDVQNRPRSTSLLNMRLNTASPKTNDTRYPTFNSDKSALKVLQNMQNTVQVTQPQLEGAGNGYQYQGFDFENPQFDPQLSDCQTFNETVFSKEFVQSRLCQQVESVYGDPQKYHYYQPTEMQNSLYLLPAKYGSSHNENALQEDPLNRMYRKKKWYNSSLESPRSPKNVIRKTKKGKTRFRDGSAKISRHKEFKEHKSKKFSENDTISADDISENSISQIVVPPLSLEDLETYDQVLTLIRTAREEAAPYLCLPEEIILYIFSFLPTNDLCRCARVCKQFHRISTDESLWKEIVLRKRNDLSDEILAKIGQKRPISLTITQCHSNKVTEGGLRELFRNCGESLQDLGFSACNGKALIGELILLHASRCKGLRSIDISWANVSDIGIQAFSEAVDRLECICMNGCQAITDESIRCIAVRHSKSVRVVEMFGCFNLSHVALSVLQKHCPNIETVNMGQCHKVTNASVSEFSKHMPKLENIDLRGCKQIRDSSVKDLASNCHSLSTLVIANCSLVTDASLLAIASNIAAIRCLDVCGCTKISDRGVVALAKACNKLEVLDLSSTKVTDKGVISLANYCHKTLETLKLSFCHGVSESSLQQLAKKCTRLKLLQLYGCKRVRNISKVQDLNRKLVVES